MCRFVCYKADENLKLNCYYKFADQIAKKSKVQVFIEQSNELAKFLKNYLNFNKIAIGMGAGSISSWLKELPNLIGKKNERLK